MLEKIKAYTKKVERREELNRRSLKEWKENTNPEEMMEYIENNKKLQRNNAIAWTVFGAGLLAISTAIGKNEAKLIHKDKEE